eukprot:1995300-Alexandrium_andersonii.AAC.1
MSSAAVLRWRLTACQTIVAPRHAASASGVARGLAMACRPRRPRAAPKRTTARLSPATVLAPAVLGPPRRSWTASAPPHASAV